MPLPAAIKACSTTLPAVSCTLQDKNMAARAHNAEIVELAKPGDLIEFPRGLYSHFAVYIGEGITVGKEGYSQCLAGDLNKCVEELIDTLTAVELPGAVVERKLIDLAGEDYAKISNKDNKKKPLPTQEVVQRAKSQIGESSYNLLINNCEHFATWCRYGVAWCDQLLEHPTQYLQGWGVGEAAAQAFVQKHGNSIY